MALPPGWSHSVAVAYYSYRLAFFLGLSFHARDLVRGALLHDYFLYDAQDGDPRPQGPLDPPPGDRFGKRREGPAPHRH